MSIFSSLNTASSGLNTSQLLVDTTSHNISNANNEYYSRQRVALSSTTPLTDNAGFVGQGVKSEQIIRIHSEFVNERYRSSSSDLSFAETEHRYLDEVAAYFSDIEGSGLFSDLENYFNSWNNYTTSNAGSDSAKKVDLAKSTDTFASNLNYTYSKIEDLQELINEQVKLSVDEFNRLGEKVAQINKEIVKNESNPKFNANDLRDERDRYELAMSKLLNIDLFKGSADTEASQSLDYEDMTKHYNMTIDGYSILKCDEFRELELDNLNNPTKFFNIKYSMSGNDIDITNSITGGKVGALLELRGYEVSDDGSINGGKLQNYLNNLDSLAKSLIENTNDIYASSPIDKIESRDIGIDANLKLSESDLKIDTALNTILNQKPSFDINVFDNNNNLVSSKTIELDENSTMQSIVDEINASSDDNLDNDSTNDVDDFFEATFQNGVFSLTPKDIATNREYKVAIEDSSEVGSNFAGVIGANRFFEGDGAKDIALNSKLAKEPLHINRFDDMTLANKMVQFQYEEISFYKEDGSEFPTKETISDFYRLVSSEISSDTFSSNIQKDTKESIFYTVKEQFDNISKVSLDEELANLMKFQTAYQANAKVVTTIDTMIDSLLGIKR